MGKIPSTPTDEQIRERTCWGWLWPYLIALDEMFLKRWVYWLSTLHQGVILEESIPQIKWPGMGHEEPRNNLETCLHFNRRRFSRQSFSLFVEWLLFGFGAPSVKEMPPQIEDEVNAFWYKTFNLGLLLKYPHDYLGEYAAELYGNGPHNPTAYFPTPMNVSVMMATMLLHEQDKTASVCDPCVGSGRLLMAASNYSLNLYGMDIDYPILNICKANMWMYVPWCVVRPPLQGLMSTESLPRQDTRSIQPIQQTTPEAQKKLLEGAEQMNLFAGVGIPEPDPSDSQAPVANRTVTTVTYS